MRENLYPYVLFDLILTNITMNDSQEVAPTERTFHCHQYQEVHFFCAWLSWHLDGTMVWDVAQTDY